MLLRSVLVLTLWHFASGSVKRIGPHPQAEFRLDVSMPGLSPPKVSILLWRLNSVPSHLGSPVIPAVFPHKTFIVRVSYKSARI